ncbi:lipase 3-like [Diabrotica undecimpunctata]|uniref:lipase 3-like n=1 Tax=Diabrotica undecimpunctata TaxID=50387 RepID=UPI003B631E4C
MKTSVFYFIALCCCCSAEFNIFQLAKHAIDIGSSITKDVLNNVLTVNDLPEKIPVPEIIKREGYEVESHFATTPDGYILNLHRIPHGKQSQGKRKSTPIYLQHGLLCSSADWVIFGQKRALAYILADEGYDVWMGNVRGNTYSRNHTYLLPEESQFWKFSWNEIGMYDIPTMVDYILKATEKPQLFHIGHSQGTTSFYVMTSERPEYNQKIKAHISLAPVAYMENLVSPLVRALAFGRFVFGNKLMIGKSEFMPSHAFFVLVNNAMCSVGIGAVYCKISIFAISGFSPDQMDPADTVLIYAHYPAGASTKQVLHYAQEVESGHFRKYDFGPIKNRYYYNGSEIPPDYNLSKISAPIHLIYSSNDWLSSETDVNKLHGELKSVKEKYWVPLPTWNHMDYLFGKDAPKLVYAKILNILAKYES